MFFYFHNPFFRMPYCEAVILEGLRVFVGNTFAIPHRAMQDTVLAGYNVPKVVFLFLTFDLHCTYVLIQFITIIPYRIQWSWRVSLVC